MLRARSNLILLDSCCLNLGVENERLSMNMVGLGPQLDGSDDASRKGSNGTMAGMLRHAVMAGLRDRIEGLRLKMQ